MTVSATSATHDAFGVRLSEAYAEPGSLRWRGQEGSISDIDPCDTRHATSPAGKRSEPNESPAGFKAMNRNIESNPPADQQTEGAA